jgi:hypothetical protein
MHITVTLNSISGLPEDSSVIYFLATMGQQCFKSNLFRLQKTGEQRQIPLHNICGRLYTATPSPLRLMLIEACEFGDYCLAMTTIQPAELMDNAGPRSIVMEPISQNFSGPKPTLSLCFCEGGNTITDPTRDVTYIECPQTEAVRTDRLIVRLAPYGETFLKYEGLPPQPTNLTELQTAVRRRSLDAGYAGPDQQQPQAQPLQQLEGSPAPEQASEGFKEVRKPRRNSLMDRVAEKISTVSANINRASAPLLHQVDATLNKGINQLNDFVGSMAANNSQQRYTTAFPELAKSETLLAEFECESVAPTGKIFPGWAMLTTNSLLFISREIAPSMFRFRMELVNILSVSRILINGADGIQIFDLNHNFVQFQHFGNIATFLAEGVCQTIPAAMLTTSLSQPLSNSMFSKAFRQIEAAWQARAELPPPEFQYAPSQMPILST